MTTLPCDLDPADADELAAARARRTRREIYVLGREWVRLATDPDTPREMVTRWIDEVTRLIERYPEVAGPLGRTKRALREARRMKNA